MSESVTIKEQDDIEDRPKPPSMHPRLRELLFGLKRFVSNPLSVVGLVIIFRFAVIAICAPRRARIRS